MYAIILKKAKSPLAKNQVIALGENIKNLDKVTDGKLLSQYSEINWRQVMGMRDILSHHYFNIDAEIVYDVCDNHLKQISKTIRRIRKDLNE